MQPRRWKSALVAGALALAAVPTGASSPAPLPEPFAGEALDRRGRIVYREYHEFVPAGGAGYRSVTVYRDATGRKIGLMEADYATSPFAPDYRMVDFRFDSEQRVRREGNRIHVRSRTGSKEESKVLEARPGRDLVIGPGFNELIKVRWRALLAGDTLTCDFVIPSRMQLVTFRIRHVPDRSSASAARFRVEVDNMLLRLVAPALEVEYDRDSRRLLAYEGPSHVTGDADEARHVLIRFPNTAAASAAD
jgi:hypothetical protein